MIDSDLIQAINNLNTNSAELTSHMIAGLPRVAYITQGGQRERIELPPPPIDAKAKSIETLCKVVNDFAESDEDAVICSVWHTEGKIVGVLNDDERMHKVTMDLRVDPRFHAVRLIENNVSLTQADLRRWLIATIGKRSISTIGLIDAIKNVKFTSASDSNGTVDATSVGMGKSVMAKATGASELPESFVITTPVYIEVPSITVELEVLLDVDPIDQKFILRPAPGELQRAMQLVHAKIGEELTDILDENYTRVLYGSP